MTAQRGNSPSQLALRRHLDLLPLWALRFTVPETRVALLLLLLIDVLLSVWHWHINREIERVNPGLHFASPGAVTGFLYVPPFVAGAYAISDVIALSK
jgi:hypothetical protein